MRKAINYISIIINFILFQYQFHMREARNVILSSYSSPLPISISSVLDDLEADGVTNIDYLSVLNSRSITNSYRSSILLSLLNIQTNEALGENNALGVKLEEEGLVIVNLSTNASIFETSETVKACNGFILFLVSNEDLQREEGLFYSLAPTVELYLMNNRKPRALVVLLDGIDDIEKSKCLFESMAGRMLASIVQPSTARTSILSNIFSHVVYLSTQEENLKDTLLNVGLFKCPLNTHTGVVSAVWKSQQQTKLTLKNHPPRDVAAARMLRPVSQQGLQSCLQVIRQAVYSRNENFESTDESKIKLVPDFGALCTMAYKKSLNTLDAYIVTKSFGNCAITKTIRYNFIQSLQHELSLFYEKQLSLLQSFCYDQYVSGICQLRLSPNLHSDMECFSKDILRNYIAHARTLNSSILGFSNSALTSALYYQLRQKIYDYKKIRLEKAIVDGKYQPVPRRGVNIGFHCFLPKPFGNDYRQEPWNVYTKDNMIYVPKDKLTDINEESVLKGDWIQKGIVPCPSANDMIYMK